MSGLALALERMGYDYRVPADEALIFGQRHVRTFAASVAKGIPIWHPVDEKTGFGFLFAGRKFVATKAAALPALPAELSFVGENKTARLFGVFGWDFSERELCWTNSDQGALYFQHTPAEHDIEIVLDVIPALFPTRPAQRMMVSFNSSSGTTFTCSGAQSLSVRVAAQEWNKRDVAVISFSFPDCASPVDLGLSADRRKLAFSFSTVRIRELDEALSSR